MTLVLWQLQKGSEIEDKMWLSNGENVRTPILLDVTTTETTVHVNYEHMRA